MKKRLSFLLTLAMLASFAVVPVPPTLAESQLKPGERLQLYNSFDYTFSNSTSLGSYHGDTSAASTALPFLASEIYGTAANTVGRVGSSGSFWSTEDYNQKGGMSIRFPSSGRVRLYNTIFDDRLVNQSDIGKAFRVTFQAKTAGSAANISTGLMAFRTSDYSGSFITYQSHAITNTWQEYTYEFTITSELVNKVYSSGTNIGDYMLTFNTGTIASDIYVDELRIIELAPIPSPPPLEPGQRLQLHNSFDYDFTGTLGTYHGDTTATSTALPFLASEIYGTAANTVGRVGNTNGASWGTEDYNRKDGRSIRFTSSGRVRLYNTIFDDRLVNQGDIGKAFRVTFQAKTAGSAANISTGLMAFRTSDYSGSFITYQSHAITNTWQEYTYEFTITSELVNKTYTSGTNIGDYMLTFNTETIASDIYVDELRIIELAPIPSPPPLERGQRLQLHNSFDYDFTGTLGYYHADLTTAVPYLAAGDYGGAANAVGRVGSSGSTWNTEDYNRKGGRSVYFPASGRAKFYNSIFDDRLVTTDDIGKAFRVTFQAKTSGAASVNISTGLMTLRSSAFSGAFITNTAKAHSVTPEWQEYTYEFTITSALVNDVYTEEQKTANGATAVGTNIGDYILTFNTVTGGIYVDELRIIELAPSEPGLVLFEDYNYDIGIDNASALTTSYLGDNYGTIGGIYKGGGGSGYAHANEEYYGDSGRSLRVSMAGQTASRVKIPNSINWDRELIVDDEGRIFEVTFYAKRSTTNSAQNLSVGFMEMATGTYSGSFIPNAVQNGNEATSMKQYPMTEEWVQHTFTFTVNSAMINTGTGTCALTFSSGSGTVGNTNNVYIDNLKIVEQPRPEPPAEGLVLFEDYNYANSMASYMVSASFLGDNYGKAGYGIFRSGGATGSAHTNAENHGEGGGRSLRISTAGANESRAKIYNSINWDRELIADDEGRTFEVTFYAKRTTSNPGGNLRVGFMEMAPSTEGALYATSFIPDAVKNSGSNTYYTEYELTEEWVQHTFNFTVTPAMINTPTGTCALTFDTTGANTVFMDDLKIIAKPVPFELVGEAVVDGPIVANGTFTVTQTIKNNTDSDVPAVMLIAAYDNGGNLLSVSSGVSTALSYENPTPISATIDKLSSEYDEDCVIKVFIWEDLVNMNPLLKTISPKENRRQTPVSTVSGTDYDDLLFYDTSGKSLTGEEWEDVFDSDEQWRKDAWAAIEQNRKGDIKVIVKDSQGNFINNAEVNVNMYEHEFQWGTSINGNIMRADTQGENFRNGVGSLFNSVVLESEHKWNFYEKAPLSSRLYVDAAKALGIKYVRGHALMWDRSFSDGWADNATIPEDVYNLYVAGSKSTLDARTRAHFLKITDKFKDELVDWDVLNEPLNNKAIREKFGNAGTLGADVVKEWFDWAREGAGPDVKLYVNETSIHGSEDPYWGGANVITNFNNLLTQMDSAGVDYDGIGVQGHFPPVKISPTKFIAQLNQLATHGKEMKVTEFDMRPGMCEDPEYEASFVRDILITTFAMPEITGFTMWGFWSGSSWVDNTPIYDVNWVLKESGKQYIDLVYNKWWTQESGTTDASGEYSVSGYYGDYDITVTANGKTRVVSAQCYKGEDNTITITLD